MPDVHVHCVCAHARFASVVLFFRWSHYIGSSCPGAQGSPPASALSSAEITV